MSSRVFVPFDNNPTSVSVKTESYTIPAGKYAKVYVECDSGGQFTINGSVAVDTDPFLNIDVSTNSATIYTVPTGYRAVILQATTNVATIYTNGNIDYRFSNIDGDLGPGGTVSKSGGDGATCSGVAIPSNATHRQAEFFLPSGTVISGSGNWKATVMEYNAVT